MFGPDVGIWRARLAIDVAPGEDVLAPLSAAVHAPPPFAARPGALAWAALAAPALVPVAIDAATEPQLRFVLLAPIAPPGASHRLTWPAMRVRVVQPPGPPLIAPPRTEPPLAIPAVKADLAPALAQLVRRRMVPASRLSAEGQLHWLRRLADARKMAKTRLQLLGLFTDVQLAEGGEVRHQAAADTVTFPLSPVPVPPSTIVLARRTDTGELVVGRFY